MAVNNIYRCMQESVVTDVNGKAYPDVLTSNINNIPVDSGFEYYELTETDIKRFDLFVSRKYGVPYFDDLLLIYNNKYKHDLQVGDVIVLPVRDNFARFFRENKKKVEV